METNRCRERQELWKTLVANDGPASFYSLRLTSLHRRLDLLLFLKARDLLCFSFSLFITLSLSLPYASRQTSVHSLSLGSLKCVRRV